MKIYSWNVNGIRAVLKKGFLDFIDEHQPDIICLQETKAHPEQVDAILHDYKHYWNSAEKKGYSGTVIFSKTEPINVTYDMGIPEHDNEGRVIAAEYEDFILVTVYTPNSKRELLRLEYRQQWDKDFLSYMNTLEKKKPVVFCGDLNVAHKEIDLKNPKSNRRNPGFTDEERSAFDCILESGFIDSYRYFNPDKEGAYTWWSYMFSARSKNVGWRIDYFCISPKLKDRLEAAKIHPEVLGSDHCPVSIILK